MTGTSYESSGNLFHFWYAGGIAKGFNNFKINERQLHQGAHASRKWWFAPFHLSPPSTSPAIACRWPSGRTSTAQGRVARKGADYPACTTRKSWSRDCPLGRTKRFSLPSPEYALWRHNSHGRRKYRSNSGRFNLSWVVRELLSLRVGIDCLESLESSWFCRWWLPWSQNQPDRRCFSYSYHTLNC